MKILEVNKFNYLRRGAEKHFLDLVALLKSKGNEVAVFSMHHPKNEFSPWKKYFVSYAGFGKSDSWFSKLKGFLRIYSWEAKRKIGRLLDDFTPDLVHLHNIYHHISPSILSEIKKRGIPVVMTVHDYNLVCPDYSLSCGGADWTKLKSLRYLSFVKNKCFKGSYWQSLLAVSEFWFNRFFGFYEKHIDLYICPSDFVKETLAREGIDRKKMIVLRHFNSETPLACRWDGKKKKKERYAFYYGSISKEKGLDSLIKIFENVSNVQLYLAGAIEENFRLPQKENIKYLGFLDPKEVDEYIKGSLFTISLSGLPETFGLMALESMKNGKPFIGLNRGALKEIIDNNVNGYLCESESEVAEKIKILCQDEGLRILFSRNALEKSRNFNSEEYYNKLIGIFRDLKVAD